MPHKFSVFPCSAFRCPRARPPLTHSLTQYVLVRKSDIQVEVLVGRSKCACTHTRILQPLPQNRLHRKPHPVYIHKMVPTMLVPSHWYNDRYRRPIRFNQLSNPGSSTAARPHWTATEIHVDSRTVTRVNSPEGLKA